MGFHLSGEQFRGPGAGGYRYSACTRCDPCNPPYPDRDPGGDGYSGNDAGTGIYDRASGGAGYVPEPAEPRTGEGDLAIQAGVFLQAVPDLCGDGQCIQSGALCAASEPGAAGCSGLYPDPGGGRLSSGAGSGPSFWNGPGDQGVSHVWQRDAQHQRRSGDRGGIFSGGSAVPGDDRDIVPADAGGHFRKPDLWQET